jgi:hypothetical protein
MPGTDPAKKIAPPHSEILYNGRIAPGAGPLAEAAHCAPEPVPYAAQMAAALAQERAMLRRALVRYVIAAPILCGGILWLAQWLGGGR